MESTLKFQRGDIYFVRLDSSTGSEQNGTRPAVILQNDVGNTHSPTLIVATLTSKTEKKAAQPTHCLVEPEKLEPSIVQAEQIFTIDKSRVQNFVGHLTPEEMSRVDDAVKISLALNPMGSMHILDEIIDKMVRQIFSRLRGIPKEQLITSRYAKETAERKNHLQALQAERDKAEKDLLALKTEILAVIKGESAFPKDTLAEMIAAQEKKHTELDTLCEEASAELERNAELMANVSQLYEELISYADLYDSASFEAKKMIVSQLIRRVEVYRGYQIHVDFNFDLAQYLENSDELAC